MLARVVAPSRTVRVHSKMKATTSCRIAAFLLAGSALLAEEAKPVKPHTAAPAAAPLPSSEQGKVDINTADIPTLEAIPEIGTNFANAVVASRPFKSVDDLERVLKISPEKMSELRRKVTASKVRPAGPAPADNRPGGASKPPAVNDGKATNSKTVTERYDETTKDKPTGKK
jgi:DNA uptake protein ComE-like DNA-binding protein